MKRIIPHITFVCFTGLTVLSGLPVMAGGCSSHMNKKAEIKCAENDSECKASKLDLKDSLKS